MLVLDTNVIVGVLRQYPNAVKWHTSIANELLTVPGFVVMELVVGCRNKHELSELNALIKTHLVYWPDGNEVSKALDYLARYNRVSGLGVVDALIAACAVALRVPLCTFDNDFKAVPRLKIIASYTWPSRLDRKL